MNLEDFLLHANPDDGVAAADARAYCDMLINARDIRSYLIEKGKWRDLVITSEDPTHGMSDAASGLILAAAEDRDLTFKTTQIDGVTPHERGLLHHQLLDGFIAATLLDADDKTAILALATNFPFKNTTLQDVQDVRHPADWLSCTNPNALEYVESLRVIDVFTFVSSCSEYNASYMLRMNYRENEHTEWKTEVFDRPMRGHKAKLLVSQQLKRFGAPSTATQFLFEYKARNALVINSVSVEI